jgi:hypothetical protein
MRRTVLILKRISKPKEKMECSSSPPSSFFLCFFSSFFLLLFSSSFSFILTFPSFLPSSLPPSLPSSLLFLSGSNSEPCDFNSEPVFVR